MDRKVFYLLAVTFICISSNLFGQAPGGISTGLTVWYHAEAGTTVSPANVLTSWTNQANNPNLTNLTPNGGAIALSTYGLT